MYILYVCLSIYLFLLDCTYVVPSLRQVYDIDLSSRKSWHGKTNLPQNHKKTEYLKPILVNLFIYNRVLLFGGTSKKPFLRATAMHRSLQFLLQDFVRVHGVESLISYTVHISQTLFSSFTVRKHQKGTCSECIAFRTTSCENGKQSSIFFGGK